MQIREANIARNAKFLAQLGFVSEHNSSPDKNKYAKKELPEVANEQKQNDEYVCLNRRLKSLDALLKHFPSRGAEIRQIWGHMDEHFRAAPALVVYGCTGSGKTDICVSVLKSMGVRYAYLMCDSFSTVRQLVRSIWYAALTCCKDSSSSSSSEDNSAQLKLPSSFVDLVAGLSMLLESNNEVSSSSSNYNFTGKVLYLLLDRVECADVLEK